MAEDGRCLDALPIRQHDRYAHKRASHADRRILNRREMRRRRLAQNLCRSGTIPWANSRKKWKQSAVGTACAMQATK